TLSVCLMSRESYIYDYKTNRPYLSILNNYNVGYEQCDFHKLTGWGRLAQHEPAGAVLQSAARWWWQARIIRCGI
ncbi:MAG: hypothetical protein II404_12695, partial [Prevotella sp.]|nr:hypothetical protein [Prevotella sp.]